MQNYSNTALIGHTGFVGSSLLKQTQFTHLYRSTNIHEIAHKQFDLIVCAGAPAQKWLANRDPAADLAKLKHLMSFLETVQCDHFALISTVDVFKNPIGVYEDTPIDEIDLHAYGLHRRVLEKFIEQRFKRYSIVRLPGLVGPGLRKNVLFDLLNQNNLPTINSQNIFQFYPMTNLWYDLQIAMQANLRIIHLTAEPISVQTVAEQGFGREFNQPLPNNPIKYDLRSRHNQLLGGENGYHYNQREVIQAVRAYAQSETKTLLQDVLT